MVTAELPACPRCLGACVIYEGPSQGCPSVAEEANECPACEGNRPDRDIAEAVDAMDRDPLDSFGIDPLADAIHRVAQDNAQWAREHLAA